MQNGPLAVGTGSNPVHVAGEYDLWWHLLGLFGGGFLAPQVLDAAARRKATAQLEASNPETTRHAAHGVATYRRLASAIQVASVASSALVLGSFVGYGWGHGWGGALLGILAALTAGAGVVFWRLPDTLEISPDGMTVHTRTSSTTVTWGLVTVVGVERSHGLQVRYLADRKGKLRPARLGLASFAASNPGLGLVIARGLHAYRETHPAPAPPTAPGDGLSDSIGVAGVADAMLGPRLAAWALDVVYMSVCAFVFIVIMSLIAQAAGHTLDGAGGSALVLGSIPPTLAVYLGVLWRRGRTWGMRLCRLELEGTSPTGRPTWRQVGLRLLAAVPSMVAVVPVALLISPRQPFHDRVAGTRMVRIVGDVRARPRNGHTPNAREA